jgi:CheY-like chemotaxis protein
MIFQRKSVDDMTAKILVTMEHESQRTLIGDCLEHAGHNVTKVDTFHHAMEFLRTTDFDLIVSDVHLQNGGSVFDFLRWVKGDPYMHAVPFVCFSAEPPEIGKYLSDGVRTAARSLGAARYISMERFDAPGFLHEIEWLIPQERAGSYYLGDNHGDDGRQSNRTRLTKTD